MLNISTGKIVFGSCNVLAKKILTDKGVDLPIQQCSKNRVNTEDGPVTSITYLAAETSYDRFEHECGYYGPCERSTAIIDSKGTISHIGLAPRRGSDIIARFAFPCNALINQAPESLYSNVPIVKYEGEYYWKIIHEDTQVEKSFGICVINGVSLLGEQNISSLTVAYEDVVSNCDIYDIKKDAYDHSTCIEDLKKMNESESLCSNQLITYLQSPYEAQKFICKDKTPEWRFN